MELKRLPLKTVLNFRDLGGYPANIGMATKWRTIFRADGLFHLEDSEVKYILDYCRQGLVIDLRGTEEQVLRPNTFSQCTQVKFLSVPLISEDRNMSVIEEEWRRLDTAYIGIIKYGKSQIKLIMEAIAQCLPSPIIYNCTAGKDRTGIVSALLLGMCGVDRYDIISDYEISGTYIKRHLEKVAEPGKSINIEHVESPAAAMHSMLDYVNDNYGSVLNYLESCGVTSSLVDKIKKHFLATAF